jgi:hypothetical protein
MKGKRLSANSSVFASRILRIAAFLGFSALLFGQDSATLSSTVVDPTNAVVPGAEVTLIEVHRGTLKRRITNESGVCVFDSLPPGDYSVEVAKQGFNKLRVERVHLNVRDRQSLRFELQVSRAETPSVTVTSEMEGISSDTSTGTAVDHTFAENLPLSSRNAEALIALSPGVIRAAGGGRGGGPGDDVNVNGLRSNTNYYTVDGVSENRGIGAGPGGGGGPFRGGGFGGGPPGMGGSASDMMPLDSMQEFRVQTSTFAPEFGRTPGAQVAITTRAGNNALHGSLFEYLRNERFDANDWFANEAGIPRGKMRQNRLGGTLGGPVWRNRTFFFASYEGSRLRLSDTVVADVPDMATRRSASKTLRPYLDAFPVPNGAALEDGAARFSAVVTNPSTSDSGSLRLDHTWNEKSTMFVRYSLAPSQGEARGSQMSSPNIRTARSSRAHSFTASLISLPREEATNDFRINVSRSSGASSSAMDSFGGAIPLAEALVFPKGITSSNGQFSLNVPGLGGYSIGGRSRNEQQQLNIVDGFTRVKNNHQYKMGVDFRRTTPTYFNEPYSAMVMFRSLIDEDDSLLSGKAMTAVVNSSVPAVYPAFVNFSFYAQDTYKATERTTLTYGLRWDVNPAPGTRSGPRPFALSDSTLCSLTQNRALYRTRWTDVAPRLGLAYQMDTTPGREMMFRGGIGAFFDVGYGTSASAFSGAPYVAVRTLTEPSFPLTAADLKPPSLPPTKPYGQISAADVQLKSPVIFQWNATLERWFGRSQMLSVGYVGTMGRRLMRVESQPSFGADYDMLQLATNGATSDYHGLQAQFRRRLSKNFQAQVSYTLSHAIDSASTDVSMGFGFATMSGGERGSSNFDVRHNLSATGSYQLPSPKAWYLRPLFDGWWTDWVASARSGLPFDVQGISTTTSDTAEDSDSSSTPRRGVFGQIRPDYTGQPLWLRDASVPGGRRLNPAAFSTPSDYRQGNLGRNVIRGFPAYQVDFSVRRQISFTRRLRLNIVAQAFNVLNNPNFANPSADEGANLSSPNFGVVTRMLGQSMGPGGSGSLNRTGGPRSLQLALRLQF